MIHISYFGLINPLLFAIILFINAGVNKEDAGPFLYGLSAGILFGVIMMLIGYLTLANGCSWDLFAYLYYSVWFTVILYASFFTILLIDFCHFDDPSFLYFHKAVRLTLYIYFSISGIIIFICTFITHILLLFNKIDKDDLLETYRLLKRIIC